MGSDTVVAIATAPGIGGVGIVRLSGPQALLLCQLLIDPKVFTCLKKHPRQLIYTNVNHPHSSEILDQGMVVYFKAPHSYTGEDVVEFQLHGNPLILKKLVSSLVNLGARPAQPGEFTRRAFLAGKMDLLQAESVLATVEARSEEVLKRTVQQLEGHLSQSIDGYRQQLLSALAEIEVSLDYPDEFMATQQIQMQTSLTSIIQALDDLLQNQKQTTRLQHGIYTVLAGLPNAGKSSLLNGLLQEDRALVSDIPGTTRDRVEAQWSFNGIHYQLIDTAGLRSANDVLESMGIAKTQQAMAQAALVLYVFDATCGLTSADQVTLQRLQADEIPVILVQNKIDLMGGRSWVPDSPFLSIPLVKATTRDAQGLNDLKDKMHAEVKRLYLPDVGYHLINQRQAAQLERAKTALFRVRDELSTSFQVDLWTIGLREAIEALGTLTGQNATEDLLDTIFAGFCVGK